MKTKIFIPCFFAIFFIFLCIKSFAQEKDSIPVKSGFNSQRLFTGGNIGLQFGNETMVEIYPVIGYKITDKFVAGIGITYQYYNYVFPNEGTMQTSIYGGNVFARYYIFKKIFLQGEYEALNLETAFFDPYSLIHTGKRYWVGSVFGGAGYRRAIGENTYFNITLLYNFNDNYYNPYYTGGIPIIYKMGIEIGL